MNDSTEIFYRLSVYARAQVKRGLRRTAAASCTISRRQLPLRKKFYFFTRLFGFFCSQKIGFYEQRSNKNWKKKYSRRNINYHRRVDGCFAINILCAGVFFSDRTVREHDSHRLPTRRSWPTRFCGRTE